jgi:hypothetical protein
MSANTADTLSATVDATAMYLPGRWRLGVDGARDHHDAVTAAAETSSPNAPTVAVCGAGVSQVGGIPRSLVTDTCRRGRSTA